MTEGCGSEVRERENTVLQVRRITVESESKVIKKKQGENKDGRILDESQCCTYAEALHAFIQRLGSFVASGSDLWVWDGLRGKT